MQLLNNCLKYNLHNKQRDWMKTLAIEPDKAISKLDIRDQTYMRQITANNIQKLIRKQNMKKDSRRTYREKLASHEHRLLINIKKKMTQYQLIVIKAAKVITLIIMYKKDYDKKVNKFINNNNYTNLTHDITNKLQRNIKNKLNICNTIIDKHSKRIYTNKNPKVPHMQGTIKLHKEEKPIRPIVISRNSPRYKVAKHLATQLSDRLSLPYIYNVKDSIELMQHLERLHIDDNTKLCSFDITNMYTNISINETKHIN
jgi:hypothetical protein